MDMNSSIDQYHAVRPVERGRKGGVFSGPATFGGGATPSLKNTENGVPDGWLLSDLKYA